MQRHTKLFQPLKQRMETEYDFSNGKQGAIEPIPTGKTRITIRLNDEVLAWFRDQVHAAGGGNYPTLINDALCEYIQQHREPLEEILRRVLREELERIGKKYYGEYCEKNLNVSEDDLAGKACKSCLYFRISCKVSSIRFSNPLLNLFYLPLIHLYLTGRQNRLKSLQDKVYSNLW